MAEYLSESVAPLGGEEKAYAQWIFRKSGIDFSQFQHSELTDTAVSVISPLDHFLAFVLGFLPTVAVVVGVWWSLWGGTSGDAFAVSLALSIVVALILGAWVGLIVMVARVFRALLNVTDLGVRAVRAVRDEIRNVRPRALERLSSNDIYTATVWVVALPVLTMVLRRRLKISVVGDAASSVVKMVARRAAPMKVPADAEAQLEKLRLEDDARALKKQTASIVEPGLELKKEGPLDTSASRKAKGDADWVQYLETKRPKVRRGVQRVRFVVLVPMIFAAVTGLAIFVLVSLGLLQLA